MRGQYLAGNQPLSHAGRTQRHTEGTHTHRHNTYAILAGDRRGALICAETVLHQRLGRWRSASRNEERLRTSGISSGRLKEHI